MTVNLLDIDYYRRVNPDLANFTDEQATQHFFDFGLREGRDFSPVVDLDLYRAANPDLTAVGFTENRQFFDHLSRHGVAEGRLFSHSFNAEFYRASYSDLVAVGFNNEQLFEHFQTFGIDEGRVASNMFDIGFYLNSHPDLIAAGLNNRQGLTHFSQFGINEGRITSTQFDVGTYLSIHPDLIAAGLSSSQAFDHYQIFGIGERRISAPLLPIPSDPGNTIETSFDLGVIGGNRRFRHPLGALNPGGRFNFDDLYQFTLSGTSAVSLDFAQTPSNSFFSNTQIQIFADLNGNDRPELDERLVFIPVGFDNRPISTVLLPGTYWIRATLDQLDDSPIRGLEYETNLRVSPVAGLPPDGVGDSVSAARDLGTLTTAQTVSDAIGLLDSTDVYRFTLDAPTNFETVLDGTRGSVILELAQDRNNNGEIEGTPSFPSNTEIIETSTSESGIGVFLDAGTYILRLRADRTDTDYALTLSPQASRLAPDSAGNILATALDLGVLNTARLLSDTVSDADGVDLYEFEVDTPTNVGITLDRLTGNSMLTIGRDFDAGSSESIILEGRDFLQTSGSNTAEQTASSLYLTPGTYFAQVSSVFPANDSQYNLSITPTPGLDLPPDTAGSRPDSARNFDVLTGMQTVSESVGVADFFDYYRFVIDRPSQVDILLEVTDMSFTLGSHIFKDLNNNQVEDSGEFVQSLSMFAQNFMTEESLQLDPGVYFIQVVTRNTIGTTNYDLSLSIV